MDKSYGWEECQLNDILSLKNGYAFKSNEYQEAGIPVIRISDINGGIVDSQNAKRIRECKEFESFAVEKGDILIAMSGATTGKFGIYRADKKAYQNQRVGNFKPHSEKHLYKNFIYFLLYALKRQIEKDAYGGAQPNISSNKIESLKIILPPLPEQRAIVAKIEQLFSELDNGIANLKKAREQLKVYRQAVLKKAFEGELTKTWRTQQTYLPTAEELLEQTNREREAHYQQQVEEWALEVDTWEANNKEGKKPAKPKKPKELSSLTKEELEKLAELPENWQFTRLGELAELVGGVTKGRKLEGKELVSLPYLRVANVQDGYLDLSEIKYIDVLPEDLKKYKLEFGDILYTEGGDKDKLGRGTIWKDEIEECIHQNHVFRARLYSKISTPSFVAYYSQTKAAKNYFYANAKQTTNLASINMTVLSNLPIPVISSAEQHQIVQEIESRLSVCDKVEESIQESLVKAEALRQSILKKAFEGMLLTEQELEACRQEPDWEPAEQLLERIKAEKADSGKKKPKEAFV